MITQSKMIKSIADDRYVRVVKQVLNKRFNNFSALNVQLATIITEYSHKSVLTPGVFLLCRTLDFFVIRKVLSHHWVQGFFCPSELRLDNGLFFYMPKFWNRTKEHKKKIWNPFSTSPFIKVRSKSFYLQHKTYEPLSTLAGLLSTID